VGPTVREWRNRAFGGNSWRAWRPIRADPAKWCAISIGRQSVSLFPGSWRLPRADPPVGRAPRAAIFRAPSLPELPWSGHPRCAAAGRPGPVEQPFSVDTIGNPDASVQHRGQVSRSASRPDPIFAPGGGALRAAAPARASAPAPADNRNGVDLPHETIRTMTSFLLFIRSLRAGGGLLLLCRRGRFTAPGRVAQPGRIAAAVQFAGGGLERARGGDPAGDRAAVDAILGPT